MPSFGFGHSPRSLFRTATQKSDDRTPNRLLVIAVVLDLEACLCSAISKTHCLCKEFALERGKSLGRRKQRAIESGSRTLATDKMKAVSKLRPWKTSSKSSTSSDAGSGPTTEQSSSNSNSTSYTGSTSSPPSSAPVSDIDLAEQAAQEQLDRDVSRRKEAIERLYSASEAYWSYLGKKKPLPFNAQLPKGVKEAVEHEKATAAASGLAGEEEEELAEDDDATGTTKASSKKTLAGGTAMLKGLWSSGTNSILSKLSKEETVMPCEALGLSLLQASELLFPAADSSPSGHAQSLASLGTAHLSLAQLQSVFARDISNIYLARLVRSKVSIEAYQAARKKVETTRARLAAARAKSTALAEKGKRDASKKEGASAAEGLERKEREIEEELRNARAAQ